jgi:hypothetical protein
MKQTITPLQAIQLLNKSDIQWVGGCNANCFASSNAWIAKTEDEVLAGNPDDEFLTISWSDEDTEEFQVIVWKKGLADGTEKIWWDSEEGVITFPAMQEDDEKSSPIDVQLLVRMGKKYL